MSSTAPRIQTPPGLLLLEREPGVFWYGAWRRVNIAVWQRPASADAVTRIDRTIPTRVKTVPGRHSTVHIGLANAGAPTAEARTAFAETAKRWRHIIGCVSVVIEDRGFVASAVRSAVTGIHLLAGAEFPMRAHRSIDEAAVWVVETHERTAGERLSPAELLQALQAARASV